jgi:integrase
MYTIADLREFSARTKRIRPSTYRMWEITSRRIANQPYAVFRDPKMVDRFIQSVEQDWSDATIKTRLGYLGSMYQVAIEENKIDFPNPFHGKGRRFKYQTKVYAYKPFEHFKRFHNNPLFLGLWWHGMRVEELAGILPEEIVVDAPIPHFLIRHNSTRLLKNDASIRSVPIYEPWLQFLPDFNFSTNPREGNNKSRLYKKWCGISSHGFRNYVRDRCLDNDISDSVCSRICGWAIGGAKGIYGQEVKLSVMETALKTINKEWDNYKR